MKILVFSDLHDEEIALDKLKTVSRTANPAFDYVLICGDITNKSYSFLEEAILSFKNCFFIPGNNEPKAVLEKAAKLNGFLHEKSVDIARFTLTGFGFSSITPFGTPGELEEDEIYGRMSKLKIDSNTILLAHSPPYGYFDKTSKGNAGSPAILKIIQEKNPFAVFFGHIHEHEGADKIGETHLIKVPAAKLYSYCVAEINENKKSVSASFFKL